MVFDKVGFVESVVDMIYTKGMQIHIVPSLPSRLVLIAQMEGDDTPSYTATITPEEAHVFGPALIMRAFYEAGRNSKASEHLLTVGQRIITQAIVLRAAECAGEIFVPDNPFSQVVLGDFTTALLTKLKADKATFETYSRAPLVPIHSTETRQQRRHRERRTR